MVLRYTTGCPDGPSCGPYEEKIRSVRDGLRMVKRWERTQKEYNRYGSIYYIPRWAIINRKGEVVHCDCEYSDLHFLVTGEERPSWY